MTIQQQKSDGIWCETKCENEKRKKGNVEFENEMVHDGVKCSSVQVLLKLEAEIVFVMLLLMALSLDGNKTDASKQVSCRKQVS